MKKSNAMLEKENKELRARVDGQLDVQKRLVEAREKIEARLDAAQHELTYFRQTVRALHWALNMATGAIQKGQLDAKEFAHDGRTWAKVKTTVWSKDGESLSLAE